VLSRSGASPTGNSSSLLSQSLALDVLASPSPARKGLSGESRVGHIVLALEFEGDDGARRKSLRGGVTGGFGSKSAGGGERERCTDDARGWTWGALREGGGETGSRTRYFNSAGEGDLSSS
jgi:hypothetical protein